MRRARFLAAAVLFAFVAPAQPAAHEIPRSVTVHILVKPDADRLRVVVRVPLGALRDIEWPQRDGFLDIARAEAAARDGVAQWIVPDLHVFAGDGALPPPAIAAVRISLPSDRSFGSYDEAVAHVRGAGLPDTTRLPPEQAVVDALLEYANAAPQAALSIRPGVERLGVDVATALRFVGPRGVRAFEFHGDPGVVRLDPRWYQAAARFVRLGFLHVTGGFDHLLFLACLVIPLRRLRPLVLVVTSFTLAHSTTLMASALDAAPGGLWFPPLVEMLIAASIVYVAIENVVAAPSVPRRCALAFGFGLVHGFGFSFALRDTLQFAGSHLLASLVSFNVGIELGQVLVLLTLVPAAHLLFRFVVAERIGTIVLSVLIGHTAWHWMADRWTALRQFPVPAFDAPALVTLARLMLAVVAGTAAMWLIGRFVSSRRRRPVAQHADALDLHLDDVARLHRPGGAGRAGVDDVTGLQRDEPADVADDRVHVEDQVLRPL